MAKNMSTPLKNIHCFYKRVLLLFITLVCIISGEFPFILQLVEVILKTAANSEKTFTQSVQKNMRVFLHFTA